MLCKHTKSIIHTFVKDFGFSVAPADIKCMMKVLLIDALKLKLLLPTLIKMSAREVSISSFLAREPSSFKYTLLSTGKSHFNYS